MTMKMKTLAATTALWLGMTATTAQAAVAAPCLTEEETQSLFLAVAPDAIDAVGQKCVAQLAPAATLRAGLPALVARYRAAAETSWPQASAAVAKVGGAGMKDVDPAMLRGIMGPMIAQMAVEQVKPQDCAMIERVASLIEPLPPANTAGLIVVIAQAAMRDKGGKADKAPFAICPAAPLPAVK